jgi:peptide/nickel transport system permease protein
MRFLLSRLAQALPALLGVAIVAFALSLVAGDPLAAALGPDATAAQRSAAAHALGLDAPLTARFGHFLGAALRGDFGISTRLARPVGPLIAERLPATVELAGTAFALSLLLGIPAGMLAALRPRSLAARIVMGASLLGVSLPTFLTGSLLILLFAVSLRWLPSFGRGDVVVWHGWSSGLLSPSGRRALVLPAVTLAGFQAALLLRLVRAGMLEALASPHMRFARARGLPRGRLLRHALRNALAPVLAAAALQLGLLIAFAVVTETVFQWPGVGLLLVQSITAADVPVIAAYLVLVAALFVGLNLLADALMLAVDPRLRGSPQAR